MIRNLFMSILSMDTTPKIYIRNRKCTHPEVFGTVCARSKKACRWCFGPAISVPDLRIWNEVAVPNSYRWYRHMPFLLRIIGTVLHRSWFILWERDVAISKIGKKRSENINQERCIPFLMVIYFFQKVYRP